MKYAVEMGSGVMIYIPSCVDGHVVPFIKIGSVILKFIGGYTDSMVIA
jgi:hypothetical protein